MTRGNLFLITNEDYYYSTQFNGDMYIDGIGYGPLVLLGLDKVKNFEDFKNFIFAFDYYHFKYVEEIGEEGLLHKINKKDETLLKDFQEFYKYTYFLYIKNITEKDVSIFGHIVKAKGILVLKAGSQLLQEREQDLILSDLDSGTQSLEERIYNKKYGDLFKDIINLEYEEKKTELLKIYKNYIFTNKI